MRTSQLLCLPVNPASSIFRRTLAATKVSSSFSSSSSSSSSLVAISSLGAALSMKSFSSSSTISVSSWSSSTNSASSSASALLCSSIRSWSSVPPVSESAKAFEEQELAKETSDVDALLACIEKERDDEALRLDKEPPNMPEGWSVEHTEGTSYFIMKRVWNDEEHTVKATLTSRNPSLDPEADLRGEHFPFTLMVEKRDPEQGPRPDCPRKTLDFSLDVVEGECVIDKIRVYDAESPAREQTVEGHFERNALFPGPNLDEAEEEVLDAFQLYLAERQIDDQLGEFVGQYSVWIEQLEYERWLKNFHNFVSA